MYKIIIFLPTMNREKSVREYFDKCIDFCVENNIAIYVYDTSTDDKTKELIESYVLKKERYHNAIMYYKDEFYTDKTTDLKILKGLQKLKGLAEYVWVCGDGNIPNLLECCKYMDKYILNGYDLIQFYPEKDTNRFCIEELSDIVSYFKNNAWIATSYGATLFATKNINVELLEEEYNKLKNTGFLYWHYLFRGLSEMPSPKMVVIKLDYFRKNINKKTNASYGNGKFFKFWIEHWVYAVHSLPCVYDEYKDEVVKDIGRQLNLYSIFNLLLLRGTDNLDYKMYKKYENDFKIVTDVPCLRIKFFSCFPKNIAVIYVKIRRTLSGIARPA